MLKIFNNTKSKLQFGRINAFAEKTVVRRMGKMGIKAEDTQTNDPEQLRFNLLRRC